MDKQRLSYSVIGGRMMEKLATKTRPIFSIQVWKFSFTWSWVDEETNDIKQLLKWLKDNHDIQR